MPVFDKLKKLADQAKEKAGPMVADAKEKAGPLAAQAKERAVPLAAQAKVKAADLASKAAPVAAQGVDRASASLDKATKGKYTEKISGVHGKVNSTLTSAGEPKPAAATGEPVITTEPVIVGEPTLGMEPPAQPGTGTYPTAE